jgi:hypothetical protein
MASSNSFWYRRFQNCPTVELHLEEELEFEMLRRLTKGLRE